MTLLLLGLLGIVLGVTGLIVMLIKLDTNKPLYLDTEGNITAER